MSHPLRQLTRTLDILDELALHGPVSLADLTDAVEAPRASVHRLLVALEERGYVRHVSADALYQLGPAVYQLAGRETRSRLERLSAPALADIRAKTGETVNLAVVDGSRIVYAASLEGTLQPRMSSTIGAEVEPHATALGKAILAMSDDAMREAMLPAPPFPAFTDQTITTLAALAADLAETTQRGYAVEIEESTLSATCIAIAIVDTDGQPIAAISISGASARLPLRSHKKLAADIQAWVGRIQRGLTSDGFYQSRDGKRR
jgi:IclR family transcriptional regulator, acetate operon repressor